MTAAGIGIENRMEIAGIAAHTVVSDIYHHSCSNFQRSAAVVHSRLPFAQTVQESVSVCVLITWLCSQPDAHGWSCVVYDRDGLREVLV